MVYGPVSRSCETQKNIHLMKPTQPLVSQARYTALAACLAISTITHANAATYYVDPATGSISNPGTAASPWNTLEAVFTANKVFAAGDEILLRSGYHGSPVVKGNNAAMVTIRPENAAATPKVMKLVVKNGSYWDISGLDINPENAPTATYGGVLASIDTTAHHVTVRNCKLSSSSADPHTWTLSDWSSKSAKGFAVKGPYSQVLGNDFHISNFTIVVDKTATNSVVSYNFINHFSMDGIRALANDCTYEYNTITNSYISDDNHDDFFQSWSTNSAGKVGEGTVSNVVVRGNYFISNTDTAQPFQKSPQGIGCFDGMFENWVVENNVICSKTYHGIALYGAINCRLVNNIAVENIPVNGSTTNKPWVRIYAHKNGTPGSGNIVRNNISTMSAQVPAGAGVKDHNVTTSAYTTYFADHLNFDFYPKATSPAIGAGDTLDAPSIDILGNARSVPYDIGAYEFQSEVIVDNSNAADFTTSGSWISSTANAGYYGADYVHDDNSGKGSKTATFTAAVGTGTYEVYMRWTAGTNRASNLPVTIHHAGGSNTVTVNQRLNGGVWRLLGTYNFRTHADGRVVLSNTGTNGHVIADAVRFVRQ